MTTDLSNGDTTTTAMIVFISITVVFIAFRTVSRALRAGKTASIVGANFADYAREALVNATKLDGGVSDEERAAVSQAVRELAGEPHDEAKLTQAFAAARLNKDELVAYLASRSQNFTNAQKTALLRALLAVFVSDGRFDEAEHAALLDYTAAVGFDRQSAPDMLRGLARDFNRGNIT